MVALSCVHAPRRFARRLQARQRMFATWPPSLVAILDWEMATLAIRSRLGWMISFCASRATPRRPLAERRADGFAGFVTLAIYRRYARATGATSRSLVVTRSLLWKLASVEGRTRAIVRENDDRSRGAERGVRAPLVARSISIPGMKHSNS